MTDKPGPLRRFRLRLGRWLLRPETVRIVSHYGSVADEHRRAGDEEKASRCSYIEIGARYVGTGSPTPP